MYTSIIVTATAVSVGKSRRLPVVPDFIYFPSYGIKAFNPRNLYIYIIYCIPLCFIRVLLGDLVGVHHIMYYTIGA